MSESNLAIPDRLLPLAGSIMDADSHDYTPVNHWIEQFGEATRPFAEAHEHSKMPIRRFVSADEAAINAETIGCGSSPLRSHLTFKACWRKFSLGNMESDLKLSLMPD